MKMEDPLQNASPNQQNQPKIHIFSTLTVRFTDAYAPNCKPIDDISTALFNFCLT